MSATGRFLPVRMPDSAIRLAYCYDLPEVVPPDAALTTETEKDRFDGARLF